MDDISILIYILSIIPSHEITFYTEDDLNETYLLTMYCDIMEPFVFSSKLQLNILFNNEMDKGNETTKVIYKRDTVKGNTAADGEIYFNIGAKGDFHKRASK
jgi:hypothetical protein